MTGTNNPLPTAEVEEVAPATPEQIARVNKLALRAVALDGQMAELSEKLSKLADERKGIVERDLVNAMTEARLEVWPMAGGMQFALATVLNGSITKERQDEAFAFLEANGHGDLIKRKFTIQFGREDLAWAKKFEQDLLKRKKPLAFDKKTWVEPQTLGAFVREQYKNAAADGTNPEELVPSSTFSVFKMTFAKLEAPKAVKPRAVKAKAS